MHKKKAGKSSTACPLNHCIHLVNIYTINSRFCTHAKARGDQWMPFRRGFSEEWPPCRFFPNQFFPLPTCCVLSSLFLVNLYRPFAATITFCFWGRAPWDFVEIKKKIEACLDCRNLELLISLFFFFSAASYVLSQLQLKGIYFSQSWYHLTFRLLWEDHFSIHSQLKQSPPKVIWSLETPTP